jgi:hypothetical protein
MLSAIKEAKDLGFGNVVFTGGEATLRWHDLISAIEFANNLGLPTRLVTNAHWARTMDAARSRIDELLGAGLDEINYSTGDEHTRFIPIDFVVNAIVAAVGRGLNVHVMVEIHDTRHIVEESVLKHPRIVALKENERRLLSVNESPWMPLHPFEVAKYPEGIGLNGENVSSSRGCESILQTMLVTADQHVHACCGLASRLIPELTVAYSRDEPDFLREAIQEAESDFLKLWIHYEGPERILAWAAEKDPEIEWENYYAHKCQACLRLYKDPRVIRVIWEHYEEMVPAVLQAGWLQESFIPEVLGTKVELTA